MNYKYFLLDMIRIEPYRTMYLNNATFQSIMYLIRQNEEDRTIPIVLEGMYELAKENEALKKRLEDCISKRASFQKAVLQDMSKQPSHAHSFFRSRFGRVQ